MKRETTNTPLQALVLLNDEQFNEYGHIYYNLHKRYEQLRIEEDDEAWVKISEKIILDDIGRRNVEVPKPGQILLNLAYIFAAAGLKEIAGFIVGYGTDKKLEAFKEKEGGV